MILPENNHFSNIVLIGMAGAGKSTVGSGLAEALCWNFIDTDDLIAETAGHGLQEMLDSCGRHHFQALEERILLGLDPAETVIATGGSAVYSRKGMEHLQEIALVIWLDVPLPELEVRVKNFCSRGLVNPDGTSFAALYQQRVALYHRYARLHIRCLDREPVEIVSEIMTRGRQVGLLF
jgi:shikimate kinase